MCPVCVGIDLSKYFAPEYYPRILYCATEGRVLPGCTGRHTNHLGSVAYDLYSADQVYRYER